MNRFKENKDEERRGTEKEGIGTALLRRTSSRDQSSSRATQKQLQACSCYSGRRPSRYSGQIPEAAAVALASLPRPFSDVLIVLTEQYDRDSALFLKVLMLRRLGEFSKSDFGLERTTLRAFKDLSARQPNTSLFKITSDAYVLVDITNLLRITQKVNSIGSNKVCISSKADGRKPFPSIIRPLAVREGHRVPNKE